MPYANPEEQKRARRESARRRRAVQSGTVVVPDAVAVQPTPKMLRDAGIVLHIGRGDSETDEAFHTRIKQCWRDFLLVVVE